jgi:GNAT superfamily N-acetyltransferase
VRPATTSDVDAMREVGIAAGERFRSIDDPRIADRADDATYESAELVEAIEAGRAWVVDEGGAVLGFLLAEVLDGAVHVEEVSVRPEAEGRGCGSALLEAAATWAQDLGLGAVTLTTFQDVPWNRPFYERRGFVVVGEDELTESLRARRAAEAAVGLVPELRVVMRRPL